MNICLISQEFPWREPFGGVGVSTLAMARALSRAGQNVQVVTQAPGSDWTEGQESGARILGIPFHPFPALPQRLATFSSLRCLAWSREVARCFASGRVEPVDIIESPAMGGEALTLQRRRNRPPVVIKIHGGTSLHLKTLGCYRWYHQPVYHRERASVTRADRVAVISEQTRRENEVHYRLSLRDASVMPNPIDTENMAPAAPGQQKEGIIVLFVGRLDAVKGFDRMPEIIESVLSVEPSVRFVCVGAKDRFISSRETRLPEEFLRDRLCVEHLKQVALPGVIPVDRMPEVYQGSDLLVAPSRSEAWSLVCAEAAACGLPAVGARGTGMESVIVDGKTGYLEPADNPSAFAERLLELIRNRERRETMGRDAREHAVREFGYQAFAGKCLSFYEETVRKSRRSET